MSNWLKFVAGLMNPWIEPFTMSAPHNVVAAFIGDYNGIRMSRAYHLILW